MHGSVRGSDSSAIKVAAVDDHPIVLFGLKAYFAEHAVDIELVSVAPDVDALLADMSCGVPSVVLLDLRLRDGSEVGENVRRLRSTGAQVLVFTTEHRPAAVRRALDAGAAGLVLKEDPEARLTTAIRAADAGEIYVSSRLAHHIVTDPRGDVHLTEQERRVLELIARGLPHRQVARRLQITEDTVRTYRKRAIEAYAAAGSGLLEDNKQLAWRAMADGHIEVGTNLPESEC